MDWPAVWAALLAMSPGQLAWAGAFSVVSHAVFASYDLLCRSWMAHRLPVAGTLLAGFVSHAVNFSIGALAADWALACACIRAWGWM